MCVSTFAGFIAVPAAASAASINQTNHGLYHANAGGEFTDSSGTTWTALQDHLVAGGGETSTHGQPSTIDDSVPAGTPTEIWETERWDPASGDEMQYEFAVPSGERVEVRLYFYDGYSGTSNVGDRVFDVSIEGTTVLNNFDIIEKYGDDTGAMESFTVTSDGTVDIDFGHVTENPLINAIEIVSVEPSPDELGGPSSVDFGTVVVGDTATQTVTLTNLGESGDPSIDVTDISISGSDASAFDHDFGGSQTLAPGESMDVAVSFAPTDAQAKSASLEVSHSGTNSPLTVPLSGDGQSTSTVGFSSSKLGGFDPGQLTALEFGPDGRLYVAKQNGMVYALEIVRNGEDDYDVVNQVSVSAIQDIPNHDDDGSLNAGETTRQVTGLTVGGTAAQPVVYVSSSDPRIGGGGSGAELDLDTNSGAISRLTFDWSTDGTSTNVDHDVLVLGLPRSEENHSPNGLDLSADGSTLYLAQGGNTNKGAPSNNFAYTPEYALSASVLAIDLAQIETDFQAKNLQSYSPPTGTGTYPDLTFYYALPTIQTDDSTDGDDLPFGGADGVNMAKWVENGPVQVYSSGYRNPYDLVLSEDDQLYVIDNGPNSGWGGQPVNEGYSGTGSATCTNEPSETGDYGTGDQLHLATQGSYGGHAVPIRANPTGADIYDENGNMVLDITTSNSPVPASLVNPVECDYQDPNEDNSLGNEFSWTAGIDEYTASNFGGELQGDLLVVEGASSVERVELNAAGDGVINQEDNFLTPGTALGIEAVGDDGPFPGTIWTARGDLLVHEPNDYDGSGTQCTGDDDPSLDEDGDGYDNADEIDAGTDPCSAASTPPDFDDDGTSNLNDPDDDNDGLLDTEDPFAVDPDNGVTTTLPVQDPLTATSLFGDDSQAWTGLMTNGQDDYQDLYNEDPGTIGGAAGVLTVENVSAGDATQNNQENAFQFGIDAPDEPFTVATTVNGYPDNPSNYQGMGIYVGNGDQDNYVKLIVAANGGTGGIQFFKEVGGSTANIAQPDDSAVTGPATDTELYLTVDPTTDPSPGNGVDEVAVSAAYAVDGGSKTTVGSGAIPASWLDSSDGTGLAVGIISTSFGATEFTATWKDISVTLVDSAPIADAGDDQTVDEGTEVTLNAAKSSDSDGDTLEYTWTQTAGPGVSLSDPSAAQPTFTAPDVDAETTLTFEVTVSDGTKTDSDTVNVTVQDTDVASGETVFAVNAGGSEYTATDGTVYAADTNFDGGQTYSTSQSIGDTQNDPLYQSERYGDFWYNVSVPNGEYEVTLEFAEIYHGTSSDNTDYGNDGTNVGDRVFDVNAEGQQVLNDYDIFAEVGSLNATSETVTVEVTDGELNLQFVTESDNAKVSAIEVTAAGGNAAPVIDPIADQTVTEGDSTTVDVTASDADGDAMSLSLSGAPSFVSLTDAGDGTGTLSIAPQSGDAGDYQFDVLADDGQATASETVTLTVEEPTTGTYGVETGETTNVQIDTSTQTNASATMSGTLTLGDKTEATPYVKIWPQEQPEDAFWYSGSPMTSSGEFVFDVVLSPSTTYVWQAYSQSGDGAWKAGETKTFTTPIGQYFGVTTNQPSSVGIEWVTLEGEIANLGDNDDATVYFTYWKQGQKESTLTWYTGPVQESTGTFSTDVQLDPDTTYEYRAFGQSNEGEWKAGPVVTFTTQDGEKFGVETDPATNVGPGSATLNGDLTGLGDYASATPYFQYWVQGQKEATLEWWTGSAQSSAGTFAASVSGLQADTTYEFQAYAQSDEGKWTAGDVQTLTTGDTAATGSALVEITPDSALETSTYGGGTYQVTNTGEKNIVSVSFDLDTATLPDMVFDPAGTAGDPTGQGFTIASEGGTGIITAEGDSGAFSEPHNGVDDGDGYDVMTVEFNDFQPGETATFWADNDPTSIKGATVNSQEAGPVSGLELARTTITVEYADGTVQTTQLMGDGSDGGSTAVVTGTEQPAPSIDVQGVSLDSGALDGYHSAATVAAASQTITVTGEPGEQVTLVRVEGELSLTNVPDADGDGEPGYEIEAYEANDAEAVEYYSVTLDSTGTASIPVTLTNTDTDADTGNAGYNYFVAAHGDAAGDMGLASNVVVLQYDQSATNTEPTIDAITDTGVSQGDSTTLGVSAADADGDALTLSKAGGPGWVTLSDNGDGTGSLTVAPGASVPVGTYSVEVSVSDGQTSATEELAVYVDEPDQSGTVVAAINAGGGSYTATDGTVYQADQYFSGGSTYSVSQAVDGTSDDTLYQTERYGGTLGYSIPVPESGTYEVTLQFAEIYQGVSSNDSPDSEGPTDGTNENDRLFDVTVEGTQVLSAYDIFSEVGPLTATEKHYTVEVTDGTLNVDLSVVNDNAKISAITVEQIGGDGGNTGSASADFAVTANSGIDASTYNSGSFEITNTGEKDITSVTYDLSTSTFPDVVFDPAGTAGDTGAKCLVPSSGGSTTGYQTPSDNCVGPFSQPHNGVDSADGYDAATVNFGDFETGESFSFAVDIDPTSIKDASGTGAAGSVSGLELSGATVTVEYADGTTQTTQLMGDGSDGGSQATAKAGVASAPTLGVQGVSLDAGALDAQHSAATVTDATQTITVSGPAGATVELLHVEGQLELDEASGYMLEEYEANTAENVAYQQVQLDSNGQATVEVTLSNTSSTSVEGGFNHFIATVEDGAGDTGATSNVVVLELDESSGGSTAQVLHRVDAGKSTDTAAIDGGPDWTGVTGTGSQYLVSVGSTNPGNNCAGADITPTSTVPDSTPDAVFDCERYGESTWQFGVNAGQQVEVRLYIGNQYSGTDGVGDRQFDVSIEGTQVLTNYDPVADVGHANGTMKSFTVTDDGDGTITVTFEQGAAEYPLVNAIEIVEESS